MTDIIDLIDEATGCQREACGRPLGESPSSDFCSAACQQAWHAARSTPLVGYVEPTDLPQHVDNQREEFSPEVTPYWFPFHDSFSSQARNRVGQPPPTHPACEHGPCRRPATSSGRCPLHADTAPLGRLLQALLRPPPPGDGPPYTHTFTLGDQDTGGGHQFRPSVTVIEFDTVVVGSLGDALAAAVERLAAAGQVAVESVSGLAEELDRPRLPSDPRERALELRRRRNTGPQQRQRAPRRINPRGCL